MKDVDTVPRVAAEAQAKAAISASQAQQLPHLQQQQQHPIALGRAYGVRTGAASRRLLGRGGARHPRLPA
jgi:hypothetical protein